eukprot:TRINITY_DN7752_c0_g1_i1.p1 TRINITY_DN7752_c0_g1~~TRINITY_DN7752_c0_g1_i1.p1  ORF type:complete len:288 (+),score=37.83 TRINITY_DN7752_c0_g1_i1:32-895(+)
MGSSLLPSFYRDLTRPLDPTSPIHLLSLSHILIIHILKQLPREFLYRDVVHVSKLFYILTLQRSFWEGDFIQIHYKIPDAIEPSHFPSLCVDTSGDNPCLISFGGNKLTLEGRVFEVQQEIRLFDFRSREWQVENTGHISTEHTCVLVQDRLITFGGSPGYVASDYDSAMDYILPVHQDMFFADIELDLTGKSPAGRSAHTCIEHDRNLYICGGWNGEDCFSDFWALDLDSRKWEHIPHQANSPPEIRAHSAIKHDGSMSYSSIVEGSWLNSRPGLLKVSFWWIPSE